MISLVAVFEQEVAVYGLTLSVRVQVRVRTGKSEIWFELRSVMLKCMLELGLGSGLE